MATNDTFYRKTKIFVIKSIQKTDFSYFIFNNWKKIKKRLEKAYSIFGDRIKYVGPDCGLGHFPNQELAYLVLKNTSEGIKAFYKDG
jgi:methionine synthase II (cobalamin-independent)